MYWIKFKIGVELGWILGDFTTALELLLFQFSLDYLKSQAMLFLRNKQQKQNPKNTIEQHCHVFMFAYEPLFIESYAAENQDVVDSIWNNCRTRTTYQVESRPRPAFVEWLLVMVYQIHKYEGMKGKSEN